MFKMVFNINKRLNILFSIKTFINFNLNEREVRLCVEG